jgi:hypothetical protein
MGLKEDISGSCQRSLQVTLACPLVGTSEATGMACGSGGPGRCMQAPILCHSLSLSLTLSLTRLGKVQVPKGLVMTLEWGRESSSLSSSRHSQGGKRTISRVP